MSTDLATDVRKHFEKRGSSVWRGLEFLRAEIDDTGRILAALIKTLNENFAAENMVGTKIAAENARKVASQIEVLTASLAHTTTIHANRRPRP